MTRSEIRKAREAGAKSCVAPSEARGPLGELEAAAE